MPQGRECDPLQRRVHCGWGLDVQQLVSPTNLGGSKNNLLPNDHRPRVGAHARLRLGGPFRLHRDARHPNKVAVIL